MAGVGAAEDFYDGFHRQGKTAVGDTWGVLEGEWRMDGFVAVRDRDDSKLARMWIFEMPLQHYDHREHVVAQDLQLDRVAPVPHN